MSTSSLLHRSFNDHPFKVISAKGDVITLENGTKIIDACGGAAVISVGHMVPEVVDSISNQMKNMSYIYSLSFTSDAAEDLGSYLINNYKGNFEKVYFVSSGSEATEAAMKFARQHFVNKGESERSHFISRWQSYHGNTLGALSLSGNKGRRAPYLPILQNTSFSKISTPNLYRGLKKNESEEEYVSRLAKELDDEFQRIGPNKVIGFWAETIGGASTGCLVPPKGYLKAMKDVCHKYGALFVLDEIMSGSGRSGNFSAWEYDDVVPDMMTIGKALGGGYAALSSVLLGPTVVNGLKLGDGTIVHGHTYQMFPLSCAAGLAVQKIIKRDNLLENSKKMGNLLGETLHKELDPLKYVGNVRGRGLFWGVEFVKNKETKEPFDPKFHLGKLITDEMLKLGVVVLPGSGTVDGEKGDHILFAPAYIVNEETILKIVQIAKQAIINITNKLTE